MSFLFRPARIRPRSNSQLFPFAGAAELMDQQDFAWLYCGAPTECCQPCRSGAGVFAMPAKSWIFDRVSRCRPAIVCASFVMTCAALTAAPAFAQQPCNPIVDGTYCATQMPRNPTSSSSSSSGGYATPMRGIGGDLALGQDYAGQPATIGAVTFRGNGDRCVGLMFRGRCN